MTYCPYYFIPPIVQKAVRSVHSVIFKIIYYGNIHTLYLIQHVIKQQYYVMKGLTTQSINDLKQNQNLNNALLNEFNIFNPYLTSDLIYYNDQLNPIEHLENDYVINALFYINKNNNIFLIFLYAPVIALNQYIKHALPNKHAIYFILEHTLKGLMALHQKRIIHTDIKPNNILIKLKAHRPIQLYLADFGQARLIDETDLSNVAPTQTTTQGTPRYMSPEQWQGLPLGPATDLYSFGLLAYELITQQAPFGMPNPVTLQDWAMAHCQRPVLALPANHLMAAWQPWLDGLLTKHSSARTQTAQQALIQFYNILNRNV